MTSPMRRASCSSFNLLLSVRRRGCILLAPLSDVAALLRPKQQVGNQNEVLLYRTPIDAALPIGNSRAHNAKNTRIHTLKFILIYIVLCSLTVVNLVGDQIKVIFC